MGFLFTEFFINFSFTIVTICIIGVMLFAYKRGVFFSKVAWSLLAYVLIFVIMFLSRQYSTEHIVEHSKSEPSYIFLASMHGTISLWAITQTIVMFFFAQKAYRSRINFFKENKKWTALLVFVWIFSLVSGFFL